MGSSSRAGAFAAFAAVIAVGLSGCSVLDTGTQVGASSAAAEQLARQLKTSSGVTSSSVVYDPTDPAGQSVRVRVRLEAGATNSDWTTVLEASRAALSTGPLAQTVRDLRVTQSGTSGARFAPQQYSTWPTSASVDAALSSWRSAETATGLHLRFDELADPSSPVKYQVISRAESARFMTGAASESLPSGVELQGYGFDTSISPTPEVEQLYQVLSQRLEPLDATVDRAAPANKSFMIDWAPASTVVGIYSPKSAASHPGEADASLAALLAGTVPPSELAVAWIGATRTAWVTFGACPATTKRTPSGDDNAFASLIAATGYSIPPSGGAGECLP